MSGDCIYIPTEWVQQANIVSLDNSLEFKWRPEAWTPDEDCSRGYRKKVISTISFPGENYTSRERTLDTEEILLAKLTKLLDKLLSIQGNVELTRFLTEMISDDSMTPDLQEWTEELGERLEEMFQTIDVNRDGVINNEDLGAITPQNIKKFLGRMEDRFADLTDVIIDQRVDFSLGHFNPRSRRDMVKQVAGDTASANTHRDEL